MDKKISLKFPFHPFDRAIKKQRRACDLDLANYFLLLSLFLQQILLVYAKDIEKKKKLNQNKSTSNDVGAEFKQRNIQTNCQFHGYCL